MGREVCRTVVDQADLELVGAVDPSYAGGSVGDLIGWSGLDLTVLADVAALVEVGAEVVVDFSHVDAARESLALCSAAGIHAVIGTTGFSPEDLERLGDQFAGPEGGRPNALLAANFAIGAVLMMRFAALAAPWFDGAEIVELHHDGKFDAPSGTAMRTAERMAEARRVAELPDYPDDRTVTEVVAGARGGAGPGGVRMHSVRLPGLVAHQEVLLGAVGQGLTLRHDSYDRSSFMDGVALAVRAVPSRPGLTIGLEPLLGL